MASTRSDPAIEVVSWDVDGTLYELGPMMRRVAWHGLLGMFTGPRRTWRAHARLRRFRHAMNRVRARGGALGDGEMPADRPDLLALEAEWYGRAIAAVGVRPGVREMIDDFARRGLRQIVVSDYASDYKLRLLGLEGTFERIYAGEHLGYLKPAPALLAAVADDLGVEPARILHIGDRADRDGASAEGAGCRAAIIGRGRLDPTRLLAAGALATPARGA
jgi:putative hydrolase of the HAD superfamily